ncbi:MAG: Asp-tRNA(Asn)/Glu-tRNA(Gln) amidotransferase subunit GatC [Phycisphaeraceae bacterium]|nr:Asp-tRNA(Asn)/Glu-tRNA(Gln) amidotransferase subunit GatC [Phycisphaeraceae bacterium]
MSSHITEAEVRHVAQLSRLRLTSEEIHHYAAQLSNILDYVSRLNELNVEGVEPMAHALDMSNVLRPDEPAAGMSVERVLDNAPEKSPPFFRVIKVLGEGSGA